MYALNTFLRITRFIANSFVGLVVGFILGYFASNFGIDELVRRFFNL